MSAPQPKPIAALARLLDVMPDPCSAPQTEQLEGELARCFAVGHAVAVIQRNRRAALRLGRAGHRARG
ncbi:MAG: hypothetical protein ACRDYX_18350 [Egibacteraceae bacterium]